MKFDSIQRLAHVCWCPHKIGDNLAVLGVGTSSQQFDYSFSSDSALEIFALSLNEKKLPSTKLLANPICGENRFQSIIWCNPHSDLIVGGLENGLLNFYDVNQILSSNSTAALCYSIKAHSGPIQSIDANNIQKTLLASCCTEIALWNLENLSAPVYMNQQNQNCEQLNAIAWNYQTGFVLGSASYSKCILWDTRKLDPMLKFNDNGRSKSIEWNHANAVQLFVGSDDDTVPAIQLWDMRFAVSPVKVLNGQQRGSLCMAQIPHDPDIFLSSGKNNKIVGWNLNLLNENRPEVVYELPTSNWCFGLKCCPTIPGYFAVSSVNSMIVFHNLLGETFCREAEHQSKKIAELFGLPSQPSLPVMKAESEANRTFYQVKCAPLWLKRTSRATITFGGRIVYFNNDPNSKKLVHFSTISNPSIISDRACELYSSLCVNERLDDFFTSRISRNEKDDVWPYLKAAFSGDKKSAFLELLKRSYGDKIVSENVSASAVAASKLDTSDNHLNADCDFHLMELLLVNDYETVLNKCIASGRFVDAILVGSIAGSNLYSKAVHSYFYSQNSTFVKTLQSIIENDFDCLVSTASSTNWKYILSAILTFDSNGALFKCAENLIKRLHQCKGENKKEITHACLVTAICSGNVEEFAQNLMDTEAEMDLESVANVAEQTIMLTAALRGKVNMKLGKASKYSSVILQFICYLCENQKFQEAHYLLSLLPDTDTELHYYKDLLTSIINPKRHVHKVAEKSSESRYSYSVNKDSIPPPHVYNPKQPVFYPSAPMPAKEHFENEAIFQMRDLSAKEYLNTAPPCTPTFPPPLNVSHSPAKPATPLPHSQPYVQTSSTHWNDPPSLKALDSQTVKIPQQQTYNGYDTKPTFFFPSQSSEPPSAPEAKPPAPASMQNAELSPQKKAMIDTFQSLLCSCNAATKDYVTSRKIEEIHAKLSILYDKLRTNNISYVTEQQLYQLVGFLRADDYSRAIAVYEQVVAVADLAEIGSFISSIKSLLQLSVQLKILRG